MPPCLLLVAPNYIVTGMIVSLLKWIVGYSSKVERHVQYCRPLEYV